MGRPRSFDETAAVAAAAALFRIRGYTATSIDDLVAATGVHRGSLYGVFGSKQGIFARVLDSATNDTENAELLDTILAGLDLAADHAATRRRIALLIDAHSITATQLGRRILARAGLESGKESS